MSAIARQTECMYCSSKCDLHPCKDNSYHSRYMVLDPLMTKFPRTLKKVCPQTGLYFSLNLTLKSSALDITCTLIFLFPKTKPDRLNMPYLEFCFLWARTATFINHSKLVVRHFWYTHTSIKPACCPELIWALYVATYFIFFPCQTGSIILHTIWLIAWLPVC